MAMTRADKVLGLIVIGCWINLLLYAVELMQGLRYFRGSGRKDAWFLWGLVCFSLFVSTATTVVQCSFSYYVTVTLFGQDPETILNTAPIMLPIHDVFFAISSGICEGYLAYRVLVVGQNFAVFVFLFASALATQAVTFYEADALAHTATLASRVTAYRFGYVFLALEVFTDLSICATLCFYLMRLRSRTAFDKTKKLLTRLLILSVESGAVTSCITIAIVIGAVTAPLANWNVCFLFILGRAYGNTFLFNLNVRGSYAGESPLQHITGSMPSTVTKKGGSTFVGSGSSGHASTSFKKKADESFPLTPMRGEFADPSSAAAFLR